MTARAQEMGMHSLALTDHGYGHGLLEFYRSCNKDGIKPILGCEIYFTPKGRLVRTEDNRRSNHLILLARNAVGYRNLISILSKAATEGFYYKPRADYELIEEHREGLICLTACLAGPVAVHMYDSGRGNAVTDLSKAKSVLGQLKDIFADNLFLEIQYHGMKPRQGQQLDPQSQLIKNAFPLSKACEVPLIVTNDAHYVVPKQWKLRDLMMADACGQTQNDPLREIKDDEHQYYLKTVDEMWSLFGAYDPSILLNTVEVSNRVEHFDPGLEVGHRLPSFEGSSAESFARTVREGFKKKYPKATRNSPETKRLEHELKTIETLGFRDYFLIVEDFIGYAEGRSIPIGPGRGSAAGSIIAYCMDITTLDPIAHDLLFERFLNPSRVSLPDIDVDVCKERRGEIINYLSDKYGKDSVAQIITFNKLKGRGSVRTVGRVLDIDQDTQNELTSVLPRDAGEFSVSLKEVVEGADNAPKQAVQKLRTFSAQSENARDYIQAAVDLEGTYKSSGIHAAAVVIGPEPLDRILPLKLAKGGAASTQFSMDDVEDLGLLKMDLLGLDTLTVVSNALSMIMNRDPDGPLQGKKDVLTLRDLQRVYPDLEDKKVYDTIFKDGRTMGVFQCDSAGLRELLARMGCSSFSDISAALALYRPGPLDSGMVDSFVKRRRGKEKETLWHEELKPYLENTHGLPIYQEQIMFASQILCGFDMAEADNLRKVIGKKKREAIAEFRDKFVLSAEKTGKITKERANQIYDDIELFGRYAFNLAHSASYAIITYYTGWLKTYYPEYFIAAILNKFCATEIASVGTTKQSKKNDDEQFVTYLMEAQSMGIAVLPPDIATSYPDFRPCAPKTVSFGLSSLKSVGTNIQKLIEWRDKHGEFTNLPQFVKACVTLGINKRVAIKFVDAGCINFGIAKAELYRVLEGYQRPKRNGEGLTKASKSIFDDVRDLIKKRDTESKKFKEKMTDEERAKDAESRQKIYDEGMAALDKDLKRAPNQESTVIDPPGVYRTKREVILCPTS